MDEKKAFMVGILKGDSSKVEKLSDLLEVQWAKEISPYDLTTVAGLGVYQISGNELLGNCCVASIVSGEIIPAFPDINGKEKFQVSIYFNLFYNTI